jgi:rhomboid protease GluP
MAEPPTNAADDAHAPETPSSEESEEGKAPEDAGAASSEEREGGEAPGDAAAAAEDAAAAAAESTESATAAAFSPYADLDEEPAPPPTPWVTRSLVAANVVVWFATLALGAAAFLPTPQWMFDHGGNAGEFTLDGEEWRLFTAMFLHYGVLHIAMNMYGLYVGGRMAERLYGPLGLAAIYLVSGLASSLTTALRPNVVSAGASGAIFGVLGAIGAFYALHRERMDQSLAKESRGLVVFAAYSLVGGLRVKGIDVHAHVGGLVAGFACGLALELGRGVGTQRLSRTVFVGIFGLAAVISAAFLVPAPVDPARAAIKELGVSEQAVLDRWNELVGKAQAQTIGDDELATEIESDLLPRWRALRETFERSDVSSEVRGNLLDYLREREAGWQEMARGLRAHDGDQVKRGMQRFTDAAAKSGDSK